MDRPSCGEIQSYDQALKWLYDRIDYERVRPSGLWNPFRLERVEQLLHQIGSPHRRIPAVHIAGTKGKGSTAAMVDSILRESGLKVGLFTSPHIVAFEERLRVNGQMPGRQQLVTLVSAMQHIVDAPSNMANERPPTFFEITTLMAWMLFDQCQVDIAVLETGMGGRLDCTNVCDPVVTVITSIGLDHTHILGNTLEQIAAEKAGIIKPGRPVVQGQLPTVAAAVVETVAVAHSSPLYRLGHEFSVTLPMIHSTDPDAAGQQSHTTAAAATASPHSAEYQQSFEFRSSGSDPLGLSIPLAGQHQLQNAALAVQTARLLAKAGWKQISDEAIQRGLVRTFWPLRFEVLRHGQRTVIVDAAHNADSIAAFVACLQKSRWMKNDRVLIFAASADKDAAAMLQQIVPCFRHLILTRYLGNPRSVDPCDLKSLVIGMLPTLDAGRAAGQQLHIADNPQHALEIGDSLTATDGLICATGSLFLAAEIRSLLCGNISPFPVSSTEGVHP